jgi:hypothetical protein
MDAINAVDVSVTFEMDKKLDKSHVNRLWATARLFLTFHPK